MNMPRLLHRSFPFAALALVAAAPVAFAQRQELFEWSGRVDREVQISMRGDQITTRDVANTETGRFRSRALMDLPRQDGQVVVVRLNGRGNVNVVQQPSAQNGYTTTVRIEDPDRGADDYRLAGYWQKYSNCDVYRRNGVDGGGNRRDRDRQMGHRDRDNDDADDNDDRNDDRNDGYNNRDNGYDNRARHGNRDNRDCNSTNGAGIGNAQSGRLSMLHWSGNVDGELEIRLQNGRIDYRTLSGSQPTSVRADRGNVTSGRPAGQLFIAQNQGRGSIIIVQQPSWWNGFTTVIRVRDSQSGYGFYDFDVME